MIESSQAVHSIFPASFFHAVAKRFDSNSWCALRKWSAVFLRMEPRGSGVMLYLPNRARQNSHEQELVCSMPFTDIFIPPRM